MQDEALADNGHTDIAAMPPSPSMLDRMQVVPSLAPSILM
jgi:hypothetical protein